MGRSAVGSPSALTGGGFEVLRGAIATTVRRLKSTQPVGSVSQSIGPSRVALGS